MIIKKTLFILGCLFSSLFIQGASAQTPTLGQAETAPKRPEWRPAKPEDLAEGTPGYTVIKYIEAIKAHDLEEASKWTSGALLRNYQLSKNFNGWISLGQVDLSRGFRISDDLVVMEANRCQIGIDYRSAKGSWGLGGKFYFMKRAGRWIVVLNSEYEKAELENG